MIGTIISNCVRSRECQPQFEQRHQAVGGNASRTVLNSLPFGII